MLEDNFELISKTSSTEALKTLALRRFINVYGTLIRSIHLQQSQREFTDEVLETYHSSYTGVPFAPLFPNLRSLSAKCSEESIIERLQFLLYPSLTSLKVVLISRALDPGAPPGHKKRIVLTAALRKLLEAIPTSSPALEDFSVTSNGRITELHDTLSVTHSLLTPLQSLTCTSCYAFGTVGHSDLPRLPGLVQLTIEQPSTLRGLPRYPLADVEVLHLSLASVCFRNVNSLHVFQFLERLRVPSLQGIALDDWKLDGEPIANILIASSRFQGLRSFALKLDGDRFSTTLYNPLNLDWLTPLANCCQMRSFKVTWLRPRARCEAHDHHLVLFAKSWPYIEHFSLFPYIYDDDWEEEKKPNDDVHTGTITQQSLIAFATHCRLLRTLQLVRLSIYTTKGSMDPAQTLVRMLWPNAAWSLELS